MAGRMSNLPFLPCFSRRRCTCCSDSPRSSVTSKCLSASAGVCVYAFSMLFLAVTSGYVSRGVNSIRFDSIRVMWCVFCGRVSVLGSLHGCRMVGTERESWAQTHYLSSRAVARSFPPPPHRRTLAALSRFRRCIQPCKTTPTRIHASGVAWHLSHSVAMCIHSSWLDGCLEGRVLQCCMHPSMPRQQED